MHGSHFRLPCVLQVLYEVLLGWSRDRSGEQSPFPTHCQEVGTHVRLYCEHTTGPRRCHLWW